jgi:hypothetical protein
MRTIIVSTAVILLLPVTGAAAAIRLTKIQYDSPGSDTGSNKA